MLNFISEQHTFKWIKKQKYKYENNDSNSKRGLVYGRADSNQRIGVLVLSAYEEIFELVQEGHNIRSVQALVVNDRFNVVSAIEVWHQSVTTHSTIEY